MIQSNEEEMLQAMFDAITEVATWFENNPEKQELYPHHYRGATEAIRIIGLRGKRMVFN